MRREAHVPSTGIAGRYLPSHPWSSSFAERWGRRDARRRRDGDGETVIKVFYLPRYAAPRRAATTRRRAVSSRSCPRPMPLILDRRSFDQFKYLGSAYGRLISQVVVVVAVTQPPLPHPPRRDPLEFGCRTRNAQCFDSTLDTRNSTPACFRSCCTYVDFTLFALLRTRLPVAFHLLYEDTALFSPLRTTRESLLSFFAKSNRIVFARSQVDFTVFLLLCAHSQVSIFVCCA